MPWNLLIFPLLGGYYLISRLNRFKYIQQRLDKQRLVFDSILMGIVVLFSSFIIRYLVESLFPNFNDFLYNFLPIKTPFIGTTACSFLMAVAFTEIGNRTIWKNDKKQIEKAIKKVGNELELIIRSSFKENILLEFSLDTDEFYIAWVKELPIPTVSNYIRAIPIFSGFRDKKKQLVFTTDYRTIYLKYIDDGTIEEIEELDVDLIIPIKNLVHVSFFDVEMYELFNKGNHKN